MIQPIYERAIDILAEESANLALDGAQSDQPSGIGLVSKLFGVTISKVSDDYKPRAKEIASQMLAGKYRPQQG